MRTGSVRRQSAAQGQELEAGEPLSKPRTAPRRRNRARAATREQWRDAPHCRDRLEAGAPLSRGLEAGGPLSQLRAAPRRRNRARAATHEQWRDAPHCGTCQAAGGTLPGHLWKWTPCPRGGSGGLTSTPRRTRRHTCRGAWGQLREAPRRTQVSLQQEGRVAPRRLRGLHGGQADHRDVEDIAALLMGFGANPSAVDMAEVFCPGRLAEHAHLFGLTPGLAADLRTGWDLSAQEGQRECWKHLEREDPYFILGSPMCKAFSVVQSLSKGSENYQVTLKHGLNHLRFCMDVYAWQAPRGKKFSHEHFWSATSWKLDFVQKVAAMLGVEVRKGHS